jgi:C-terminal processing protease CtpA/Prc
MINIFDSFCRLFAVANVTHIKWCAIVLIAMMILAIFHHIWKDDQKKLRLWRLLCLVPMFICIVHGVIYVVGVPMFLGDFLALYLISVLALIPMLFAKRRTGYRITAVLTGILSCLCGIYFCASSPYDFNHTRESYTESFHSLVMDMDKYYILKEWKEIDFQALEAKYMPLVEEAEKTQDREKYTDVVRMFCNELHDGHVEVEVSFFYEGHMSFSPPNDYGLSTVKIDNGDVIAVCADETANSLGIEDGTVITKWNGKPILEAAAEDVSDNGFPVKTNADCFDVMYLSGTGEDTVEVSFIDKLGEEQTVTLDKHEGQKSFWGTWKAFSHYKEDKNEDINFGIRMLDDKCGYLRLNEEETDNELHDTLGYLSGEHEWAKEMFREKLRELKSQGMEYLVIDLRNNCGGLDVIGYALCDVLTDKEWYCQGLGIRKDGKYISRCDQYIHGDGEFADLRVVALTNYNCASAGDGTSLLLSKLPNVTLAGITDPNGCDQETGGVSVLSDGLVIVYYPVGLVLNEAGEPNVDTKSDRISRNPVEERIPFDYDVAMKIFRDKKDYELEWAVKYLEERSDK